jgi:hypothetical protein
MFKWNITYLASSTNSRNILSTFHHCENINEVSHRSIHIMIFFAPSHHLDELFVMKQTFQTSYYRDYHMTLEGIILLEGLPPSTSQGSSCLIMYRDVLHTKQTSNFSFS